MPFLHPHSRDAIEAAAEPETRLPIDARVIALDETAHYAIAEEHALLIRAIQGVYLYDANQRTHCCEFTPSYWLMWLYDDVILNEKGATLDELARDELLHKYAYEGGEDRYMHCSDIKPLAAPEYLHHGGTGISYDDCSYDDQIEALREEFFANPPI